MRSDVHMALLGSPLRLQLLVLLEGRGSAEAQELAALADASYFKNSDPRKKDQSVRYHLRELASVGAIERVSTEQRRGFDAVTWRVARRGWVDLERQLLALVPDVADEADGETNDLG
jgi:predicted ArsR family transcriptional regulator